MTPTHFAQALVANVILGVSAAVVVFDAQVLPALLGGVSAGILLCFCFHRQRRRRTDSVAESE